MNETNPNNAVDALSMERAVSIALLRANKALAVKCIPGEKKPVKGWEPRANTVEASEAVIRDVEFTKDNFGIHLTGKWMDVDVDTDNPVLFAALDEFLPNTPHIWGRKSKPRSHRLYMSSGDDFDPSEHMFLKKLKRIPEANVEVRGGPVSRAEYSIMPGSKHPDGEMYEWHHVGHARNTPVMVSVRRILDGIRKATATAVLAPYFTEGVRQEITMALAGFLQRVHQLTGEWAEDHEGFAMDYSEALDFFKTFLKIVEDDKSDYRDRLAAFKMSWEKGVEGKTVTGATRIAEIANDKGVIQKLYALLTDNPDVQRLELFLQRYAIWHGTGDLVDLDAAELGTKAIMSRQAASNSMGHEWYQAGDKRVKMIDYLYMLDSTTRIHGFDLAPTKGKLVHHANGTIKVNQWGGYEVEPGLTADGRTPNEDDVAPFLYYVREIFCDGRKDVTDYVLSWMADILVDPSDKPGTAIVAVGPPGAGKSTLGDILRAIIGERHSAQTNDIENIVAKHNADMIGNVFIQCDEATNSRQRASTARLKSILTDPMQRTEPKNVDPYSLPALARFLFTSNEERDAMHIPDGLQDRRFNVLKVNTSKVGNINYWDQFRTWWKANIHLIAGYLHNYAYDKKKLRWCMTTPEKMAMVTASWSLFDRWAAHAIDTGFPVIDKYHITKYVTLKSRDYEPNFIERDEWPQLVSLTHLLSSVIDAGRVSTGARAVPTVGDLISDLERAGLLASREQIRRSFVEFDERTGAKRLMSYTYVQIKGLKEFVKYADEHLGHKQRDYTVVEVGDSGATSEEY